LYHPCVYGSDAIKTSLPFNALSSAESVAWLRFLWLEDVLRCRFTIGVFENEAIKKPVHGCIQMDEENSSNLFVQFVGGSYFVRESFEDNLLHG
jgi:hypothetical protein